MTSDFTLLAEHMQTVLDAALDARERYIDSLPPDIARQVRELLQFEDATLDLSQARGVALALDVLGEPTPAAIGRWTVVRPLGRGGMASVFLVERSEGAIRQAAACKIGYARSDLEDGLRRETATLLDLGHPGIAKVLDFGHTDGGRPWMVSELVDGADLVAWANEHALPLTARLAVFEDVLSAVAHAHERLLLHQDIKPANILVDHAGRPRLIDFGLATMLGGHGDTPVLGYTPRFASPEQKRGEPLTVRSDIHALGVTLADLTAAVSPSPGRDVRAVIDKACSDDPQARYPSAAAMAADLRAIRERRPVAARPASVGYRLKRFLQRRPWPVALTAVIVLAAGFGLAAYVRQTQQAIAAGQRAESERQRAVATSAFLTDLFGSVVPNEGGRVEMKLSEFLEPAFERLKQNDDLASGAKIDVAAALASAYGAVGDVERATAVRDYGIALARAHDDNRGEARLLTDEADMHIAKMNLAAGTQAYERAIAIEHDDPQLRGRARFSYMSAAFMTEDWPEVLKRADGLQAEIDAGNAPATPFQAGVSYSRATALMRLGRLDEAERDALRAQAAYAERFGKESGPVGNALDVRMQIAMAANAFDRADTLAVESLRVAEHVFGTNHARYGEVLSNTGLLRQTQGRTREATELYRQAHTIAQATAPGTPRAAVLQMNLGSTLAMLDDIDARNEGTAHLRQSTQLLADTLGADHLLTLKSGGLLAGAEALAGDVDGALQRFERIAAIFAQTIPDAFEYADLLASYATTLLEGKRYAACVERLDQATTILQDIYAEDHWYFDLYGAYRAFCQAKLGDGDARALFAARLTALADKLPADSGELSLMRKLERRLDADGE